VRVRCCGQAGDACIPHLRRPGVAASFLREIAISRADVLSRLAGDASGAAAALERYATELSSPGTHAPSQSHAPAHSHGPSCRPRAIPHVASSSHPSRRQPSLTSPARAIPHATDARITLGVSPAPATPAQLAREQGVALIVTARAARALTGGRMDVVQAWCTSRYRWGSCTLSTPRQPKPSPPVIHPLTHTLTLGLVCILSVLS
jgi:hypothetical protein